MGTRHAFVVCGNDGLDEISITGPTKVTEVADGAITSYTITPAQFGVKQAPLDSVRGGTPADNAAIVRSVLDGAIGPRRDIVVLMRHLP